MRKYFLLSAVALMISGTANATTDYAEVTAKATIEVANQIECTDLNFGTIVVKQSNKSSQIEICENADDDLSSTLDINGDDILSVTGYSPAHCVGAYHPSSESGLNPLSYTTVITNENGDKLTVSDLFQVDEEFICGKLTIPANVKAGEYTGSFTVSVTY